MSKKWSFGGLSDENSVKDMTRKSSTSDVSLKFCPEKCVTSIQFGDTSDNMADETSNSAMMSYTSSKSSFVSFPCRKNKRRFKLKNKELKFKWQAVAISIWSSTQIW